MIGMRGVEFWLGGGAWVLDHGGGTCRGSSILRAAGGDVSVPPFFKKTCLEAISLGVVVAGLLVGGHVNEAFVHSSLMLMYAGAVLAGNNGSIRKIRGEK